MNRLILIGNGFDLAHGLKTSYTDFLIWHFGECLKVADETGRHKDLVMLINNASKRPVTTNTIKDPFQLVRHLHETERGSFLKYLENKKQFLDPENRRISCPYTIGKGISNIWMSWITRWCDERWVDIENLYYETLTQNLDPGRSNSQIMIDGTNDIIDYLRNRLEKYLTSLDPVTPVDEYCQHFFAPIQKSDIVSKPYIKSDMVPEQLMLLNFNYTPTLDAYRKSGKLSWLSSNQKRTSTINHIHGRLNDPNNPMIFGFGDELDKEYEKIESVKLKGVFKHMKSFGYFKTDNYHKLIRFIDSKDYQVFVMGHSCGLSDRTMLNMIFEHPQCRSIKIFYHEDATGKNNYTELTEEISRHFRVKTEMRRKIVPFQNSQPMPQNN